MGQTSSTAVVNTTANANGTLNTAALTSATKPAAGASSPTDADEFDDCDVPVPKRPAEAEEKIEKSDFSLAATVKAGVSELRPKVSYAEAVGRVPRAPTSKHNSPQTTPKTSPVLSAAVPAAAADSEPVELTIPAPAPAALSAPVVETVSEAEYSAHKLSGIHHREVLKINGGRKKKHTSRSGTQHHHNRTARRTEDRASHHRVRNVVRTAMSKARIEGREDLPKLQRS